MSRHATRHNKRDANEPEILNALTNVHIPWYEAGPLDGWIFLHGQWMPVEIKMPGESFRQSQKDFIDVCAAFGRPCLVWRSVDDAIAAVNARCKPFNP